PAPAVQAPTVGTDGVPMSGTLIGGADWKLAAASSVRGALSEDEEQALREFPDLAPAAPSATTTSPIPGLTPDEVAYGQDYTKGFAVGYVESYAKAYTAARDAAYGPAWQDGYLRGQAEY